MRKLASKSRRMIRVHVFFAFWLHPIITVSSWVALVLQFLLCVFWGTLQFSMFKIFAFRSARGFFDDSVQDSGFLSKRSRPKVVPRFSSRAHACASVFLYTSYASPSSKMINCPGCTFVFCFRCTFLVCPFVDNRNEPCTAETSNSRSSFPETENWIAFLSTWRTPPDDFTRRFTSMASIGQWRGADDTRSSPWSPVRDFSQSGASNTHFLFVIFYRMLYSSRMRRMWGEHAQKVSSREEKSAECLRVRV